MSVFPALLEAPLFLVRLGVLADSFLVEVWSSAEESETFACVAEERRSVRFLALTTGSTGGTGLLFFLRLLASSSASN